MSDRDAQDWLTSRFSDDADDDRADGEGVAEARGDSGDTGSGAELPGTDSQQFDAASPRRARRLDTDGRRPLTPRPAPEATFAWGLTPRTPSEVAGERSEAPSERAAGEAAGQTPGQALGEAAGQTPGRTSGQTPAGLTGPAPDVLTAPAPAVPAGPAPAGPTGQARDVPAGPTSAGESMGRPAAGGATQPATEEASRGPHQPPVGATPRRSSFIDSALGANTVEPGTPTENDVAAPHPEPASPTRPFYPPPPVKSSDLSTSMSPSGPRRPTDPEPDVDRSTESAIVRPAEDPSPIPTIEQVLEAPSPRRAAREAAAREAAARDSAARQETAREQATREGSAREETAREDAARTDTARTDTARTDTAREDAARTDAARTDTAPEDAAPAETAREGTAREGTAREGTAREVAPPEHPAPLEPSPVFDVPPPLTEPVLQTTRARVPEIDPDSPVYAPPPRSVVTANEPSSTEQADRVTDTAMTAGFEGFFGPPVPRSDLFPVPGMDAGDQPVDARPARASRAPIQGRQKILIGIVIVLLLVLVVVVVLAIGRISGSTVALATPMHWAFIPHPQL